LNGGKSSDYIPFVDVGAYVITAFAAYLLGSIPTGFLLGKARGIDIRTIGSGNIGATNVFRALGTPAGIFVLIFDGLKGYAACTWMVDLVLRFAGGETGGEAIRIVAGVCAILGHNYTCWLKFKGGKGIATSAGVLSALVPVALIVTLTLWIVIFALSRYVSLASIAASIALPFAAFFAGYSPTLVVITAALAALALYKHRSNIQRLLNGTESRIGSKPKEQAP
jgi:glycerol-3-phosphate acyltransferase PlsY